jgi:short-subunit dehydrogenase
MGPIRLTHGILPALEKEPDSHVVNISSFYGLLAWRKTTVYAASKFGLVGFSLGLRQDYPRMGVTVVCPGYVDTALFESACRDFSSEPRRPPKWLTCSADLVARKTISGIRWNRPIVVVTWFARAMWWMTRLMPGVFYRLNRISRIGKG